MRRPSLFRPGYDVLISFGHSKTDPYVLPSTASYLNAVNAFRVAYPEITECEAWNEPNDAAQPTNRVRRNNSYAGARQAGRYWNVLEDSCDNPPSGLSHCVAIAGAFSDAPKTFENDKKFVDEYISGTGSRAWKKPAWSIHPYAEGYGTRTNGYANGTGRNHTGVSYLLNRTKKGPNAPASAKQPEVWISEVGALLNVHRPNGQGHGKLALARGDLDYLLSDVATGLSKRINRFYYYSWFGDRKFDSGLANYYSPRTIRPTLYNLYKSYTNP